MKWRSNSILVLLAMSSGCARDSGQGLMDRDPLYKIPAMKEAAGHPDPSSQAILVGDLSSEDPAIRFYAIQSLERMTGQTFDYHYYDNDDARAPAIAKWQAWLKEHAQR